MSPPAESALARDARHVFDGAVRAVQAPALLDELDPRLITGAGRVIVVGAGKASIPLAGALDARLGARPVEGAVAVPTGYPGTQPDALPRPRRIRVVEAGHPVPTEASAQAATQALDLAASAGADDLVVALVSGGGSALWALPPDGVSLADIQQTTRLLLRGGVEIEALNAVRKHLSRISGGRLARRVAPARLVALVLSDVVGDDLATIASGPTVPDPTTFADALAVLTETALWERVPPSVRAHLQRGAAGDLDETPGAHDPAFDRVETVLIGSNDTALTAAAQEAAALGYAVEITGRGVQGEARAVGRRVAEHIVAAAVEQPTCFLWGGETTVTVTGTGRGGRNQEVALSAALALDGVDADVVVLSGGTDGVDGPTDAAGGWASPRSAARIRQAGLDPAARLAHNDAYAALRAAGALVRTGPTHTNVADVIVALAAPGDAP